MDCSSPHSLIRVFLLSYSHFKIFFTLCDFILHSVQIISIIPSCFHPVIFPLFCPKLLPFLSFPIFQFLPDVPIFYSSLFNSIQFYSIQFYSIQFNSIQFYSIQFNSIQFYSSLFYSSLFNSIQFYSSLFNSIIFNSIHFRSIQFYIPRVMMV